MHALPIAFVAVLALLTPAQATAAGKARFKPEDVFQLEFAADPQVSPDGKRVVYVRNFMDVMKDRRRANLWIVNVDGTGHQALSTGNYSDASPRWSPEKPFVELPARPKGAEWAEPPKVIRSVHYRADGRGYLEDGNLHVFVVSAEGGAARQLSSGPHDHIGPDWAPDGKSLVIAANRRSDSDHEPLDSEVYEITLADRSIKALTDRRGPDTSPVFSPDGKRIAYVGFDDRYQGYQRTRLYVMDRDGRNRRQLTRKFDRSVAHPVWARDGKGVYVQYEDQGDTKVGLVRGEVQEVAGGIGGASLDRPYSGGSFSVGGEGVVSFTLSSPARPANVGVIAPQGRKPRRLTDLNADLLNDRALAEIEEIWFKSSKDGRKVHGWIARPPGFDPKKKYPLILEIHGGPFASYGPHFAADVQLYAAAGYVVLYINPRGSTGYGEEFANLIHHAYPGDDFDDLMSGVDAVLSRGYVDSDNLFVTGGSGGGVLTAWIVGRTNRFRAAVSAKPVINWYSFVLTADIYPFFARYWFPGPPWEHAEHYLKRSPLSLVGKVTTPTMLLTGEADHRTPISEAEQFYQAASQPVDRQGGLCAEVVRDAPQSALSRKRAPRAVRRLAARAESG